MKKNVDSRFLRKWKTPKYTIEVASINSVAEP